MAVGICAAALAVSEDKDEMEDGTMKYAWTMLLALLCVLALEACDTLKGEAVITCKDGVCKVYIPEQEFPIKSVKATPTPAVTPVAVAPAVKPPEK